MSSQPAQEQQKADYPPAGYAWYVTVILTLAYVVAFLDRQILALLVEPIKADLGVSDTQVSLLLGLAFGIFYTLMGIPIGRLADRASRRKIIAVGITVWCVMTAFCGLARNYLQLFIARIGVGVGEATLGPSALSLISDYFPPERRARPLGFYGMGVSVGAGIAMLVGGQVVRLVTESPPLELPGIGELRAWQTVFLLVGLPGLLIALLMTTVREPVRQGKMEFVDAAGRKLDTPSVKVAAAFLAKRWKAYAGVFAGMSGATILGYGLLSWLPALFIRTWDWDISTVATAQGTVMLIAGPISVTLAGWLADRSYRSGVKDAHLRIFAGFASVMLLSAVALPLMPGGWLAIGILFINILGSAGITAVSTAALMLITPNQLRGQVSAIYYFIISIFGLTVGPTAVALLTDYVFASEAMLRYSLVIVAAVAGMISVIAPVLFMRAYRKAVDEAQTWDN